MEIKIQCNCGTKFKFDFEPVNGRVPFTVNCPTCGVDATEFANSRVQESLGETVGATEVAAAPVTSAIAEPRLRVRLNTPSHAPTPAPEPTMENAPALAASPVARRQFKQEAFSAYAPPDDGLSPKFLMGLLGAAIGVLLGCAIWYLVFHFTGKHFRLFAVLVGFTGGMGAKLMSKDEGSSQLGIIATVFVVVGIVCTAYFVGRERVHNFAAGFEGELFEEEVNYAKRAVKEVPNATDQEIRLFLAKEYADEGEQPDPASVDSDEVRLFRDVHLAQYKELASGKVREKDYFKTEMRWLHEEQVYEAKRALAAMPNESDREIRAYLAREYLEEGEKPDLNSVTAEDIAHFRAESLPELKALASGEKQFGEDFENYKSADELLTEVEASDKGPWMKILYFFSGWGFGGLGIMVLTVGLSYKICTHA